MENIIFISACIGFPIIGFKIIPYIKSIVYIIFCLKEDDVYF